MAVGAPSLTGVAIAFGFGTGLNAGLPLASSPFTFCGFSLILVPLPGR